MGENSEFQLNKSIYSNGIRGCYLIIPVLCKVGKAFRPTGLKEVEVSKSELEDKSRLIAERCNSGYVKRYVLKEAYNLYLKSEDINISDFQLFMFENGIGFVTVMTLCENTDISKISNLVNNGYAGTNDESSNSYAILYDSISQIVAPCNLEIYLEKSNINLLLNESYIFNFALIDERFKELETLRKLSLNVHKQISLEKEFEDKSESDINYTYGAKDINKESYRWGCCISTLDASYVYACKVDKNKLLSIAKTATESDLFLIILTMIQKYTCMKLNEDIHNSLNKANIKNKDIQRIKKDALEFRAFGTLAPSQISRWHNVCDTYRCLLDVLGVNEALQEIEEKIDLINSDQEERIAKKQNFISIVIAAFGLISIVASVLTIVDFISTGDTKLIVSLVSSISIIVVFILISLNFGGNKK